MLDTLWRDVVASCGSRDYREETILVCTYFVHQFFFKFIAINVGPFKS